MFPAYSRRMPSVRRQTKVSDEMKGAPESSPFDETVARAGASTHPLLGPFTYVVTAGERIAALERVQRDIGGFRGMFIVVGVMNIVLGSFQLYGGLGKLVHGHRMSSLFVPLGICSISLGVLMVIAFSNLIRVRRLLVRSSRPLTSAVFTRGIGFSSRRRIVPWGSMRRIADLGDVFAVEMNLCRTIIPKRVFEDRGERFWELAADNLVGRRMLTRAPGRPTVLVNTKCR